MRRQRRDALAALPDPQTAKTRSAPSILTIDGKLLSLVLGSVPPDERPRAARALGQRRTAVPLLLEAWERAGDEPKPAILAACSWSRDPRAVDLVLEASRGSDAQTRTAGIEGLARSHDPRAIDRLIELIAGEDSVQGMDTIARAIDRLSQRLDGCHRWETGFRDDIPTKLSMPRLGHALAARIPTVADRRVRAALVSCLRTELDDAMAHAASVALRTDPSAYVRDWAAHQLIELAGVFPVGTPRQIEAVAALVGALHDRHPKVRAMALDALEEHLFLPMTDEAEKPVALAVLAAVSDADPEVRACAVNALARYDRAQGEAAELVRAGLQRLRDDPTTDPAVRASIKPETDGFGHYGVVIGLPDPADFDEPETQRPDG